MRKDTTNMAKKILLALMITIAVVLSICVIIFLIFSLPWLILAFDTWISPDPEEPTVKYGEFPYELVYEVDGEEVRIHSTVVFEYDGVKYNEGAGKYNSWKSDHINAEDSVEFELYNDSPLLFDANMDGIGYVKISFYIGELWYYMGLDSADYYSPGDYYSKNGISPGDIIMYYPGGVKALSDEELKELFGIVVKEKHLSDPIG